MSGELVNLENKNYPGFEEIVNNISLKHTVPYLDMKAMGSSLQFTDGDHIYKTSAKQVSIELGKLILEHRSN